MLQLRDCFVDRPVQASLERNDRLLLPELFFACFEDGNFKSFQLDFDLIGEHPNLSLNVKRGFSPNGSVEGIIFRGFFEAAKTEAVSKGSDVRLPSSLAERNA